MTEPGSRILDVRPVPDDKHLLAGYRLTAATAPADPTPVIVGWPWHRAFWTPIERREHGRRTYWLPEPKDGLGPADGGHCVALRPAGAKDDGRDWTRFDQGREGSCVGWGTARALWWMWRRTVDPLDIYRAAQLVDPFPDTPPGEGTDVRSALDVLRSRPPRVKRAGGWADGHDDMRIGAFRWVQSVEDVHACLKDEAGAAGGYVVFCNSWGKAGYPHFTRIPDETLNFLLFQNWGEGAAITER
jgi:hypothetical protein